jgi:AraC-like DNA-binding protein
VVLDPFVGDGPEIDPRAPELIADCRAVPVVAMVPFRASYHESVRTLLRAGLADVADAELENTADAIRLRLRAVHAQPLKRRVDGALSRFTSANARTLIVAAAEVVADGGSALDLGAVFASRERTVAGWCEREALPTPRRLLAWLRVLLAALLLEEPRRSVPAAATGAGYASDYALRRALRDMLGAAAGTRAHSFAWAMDTFNAELRELREAARRRARGSRAA